MTTFIFVGVCFWSKTELHEMQEYERVAFPTTVPEMIAINEKEKKEKREKMLKREEDIGKSLLKLDAWKKDITARKEKRETVSSASYFVNQTLTEMFCSCFRMHE
jgi:Growth arrest and DNA-damage-inducible proteins-interacting protein 1